MTQIRVSLIHEMYPMKYNWKTKKGMISKYHFQRIFQQQQNSENARSVISSTEWENVLGMVLALLVCASDPRETRTENGMQYLNGKLKQFSSLLCVLHGNNRARGSELHEDTTKTTTGAETDSWLGAPSTRMCTPFGLGIICLNQNFMGMNFFSHRSTVGPVPGLMMLDGVVCCGRSGNRATFINRKTLFPVK